MLYYAWQQRNTIASLASTLVFHCFTLPDFSSLKHIYSVLLISLSSYCLWVFDDLVAQYFFLTLHSMSTLF